MLSGRSSRLNASTGASPSSWLNDGLHRFHSAPDRSRLPKNNISQRRLVRTWGILATQTQCRSLISPESRFDEIALVEAKAILIPQTGTSGVSASLWNPTKELGMWPLRG